MKFDITIVGSNSRIYKKINKELDKKIKILEITRQNFDEINNTEIISYGIVYFFAFSNNSTHHLNLINQIEEITKSKRNCVFYTATTLNLIEESLPTNLKLSNYALIKNKSHQLVKSLNWNTIYFGFDYLSNGMPFSIKNDNIFLCTPNSNIPLMDYKKLLNSINNLNVEKTIICFKKINYSKESLFLFPNFTFLIFSLLYKLKIFRKFHFTIYLRTKKINYEYSYNR